MTKASASRTAGLLVILCGFFSLAENCAMQREERRGSIR